MTSWEVIPLMPRSSGLGWATREMGAAFTMGGASYLPWLVGSLEECPGEGYWLSFNQRLPISYELGDCLYGLLHRGRLVRDDVTFGFRRNPDVAGNGGLGGWKRVRPIAIDYRTVASTAGVECKGDRRSKGPDGWSLEWTPTALRRHKGEET